MVNDHSADKRGRISLARFSISNASDAVNPAREQFSFAIAPYPG